MTIKTRTLPRSFKASHQTKFKNLLVSGCSFTWNNSEQHVCSWPYYLRDLAGFDNVYDLSQSGAGTNHIFNSVVYECETNPLINPDHTLVIIMWSGLSRTDVIATQNITKPWHPMSNYCFDQKFATLSVFGDASDNSETAKMCRLYRKVVDGDSQILESLIKIKCLEYFLKSHGYQYVYLNWMDPTADLEQIQTPLQVEFAKVPYLNEFAESRGLKEPNDGHPTPDGYLNWTKECLLPWLQQQKLITTINNENPRH